MSSIPTPLTPEQLSIGSIYQLHYVSWCQDEVRHGRFLGHITKYFVVVDPNNPMSYGGTLDLWMSKERYAAKLQIRDNDGNLVSLDDVQHHTFYNIKRLQGNGEWGKEIKRTLRVTRSDLMHFEILKPFPGPNEVLVKTNDEHYKIYRLGAAIGSDKTRFPEPNDDLRPMLKAAAVERRSHLVEFMKREKPWWFQKQT